MTSDQFLGLYNYWIVIFLMMTGFYIVIARKNMIKTIIGLNIFQTSVFLLYITMGKVKGGTAPVMKGHGNHTGHPEQAAGHAVESAGDEHAHETVEHAAEHAADVIAYSNPLPSVLMLTAIVVGIATTALALALIVRVQEDYGSIEEDEILLMDRES